MNAVKRVSRSARPRYWNSFNPEKYGPGLKGLLTQAYNEIPILVVAGALALASFPPAIYRMYERHTLGEFYYRRYKMEYTVVREDDPLADKILNPNPKIKYREYADY